MKFSDKQLKMTYHSEMLKPSVEETIVDHSGSMILSNFNLGKQAISKMLSHFQGPDSNYKLSTLKATTDINKIKEMLSPTFVQIYIMSGKSAVEHVLFPFLSQFFHSGSVSGSEKVAKVKQLKNDFKECERMHNQEFNEDLIGPQQEGMTYFEANVNSVIKPFSL